MCTCQHHKRELVVAGLGYAEDKQKWQCIQRLGLASFQDAAKVKNLCVRYSTLRSPLPSATSLFIMGGLSVMPESLLVKNVVLLSGAVTSN